MSDTVYALRVTDKKTHKIVEIAGTSFQFVLEQDKRIYGKYELTHTITRHAMPREQFEKMWPECIGLSDQLFAVWALTPGAIVND